MSCVCGLGPSIDECCGKYISGDSLPPTAEALMRSRYSAYVLENIDYIVASHHPDTRHEVDAKGALEWSRTAEWEGLDIHSAKGGADDTEGEVEFTARYLVQGRLVRHREHAVFRKQGDRWFYFDGDMVKAKPVKRDAPKVGRNDPCPCGSGKKYKKCHGR